MEQEAVRARHATRFSGDDGRGRGTEIQDRRQNLDAVKQADFDLARGLSEAKFQLDQLLRQREQAENAPAAPVVVESYPTPISRAVDGPEAHLLINNGRVVFVPLETLLEEFHMQVKREAYKLLEQPEVDRYGRAGRRFPASLHAGASRHFARGGPNDTITAAATCGLQRWTLIPDSNDLGEPVRLALSGFRFPAEVGENLAGPNHHHDLGVSRRFRRLSRDPQGVVSAELLDCRPAIAHRRGHRRFADGQQIGGAVVLHRAIDKRCGQCDDCLHTA